MRISSSAMFKEFTGAILAVAALAFFQLSAASAEPKSIPGLAVTYNSAQTVDVAIAPNVWLYVPAKTSPTPFLPDEKFTATFNGFLSVDLRGDYAFEAELNGNLKLEINGATVLDASGTNSSTEISKPIRLSKGTNLFRAIFTSASQGDAFIRLRWKPKKSFLQPIPTAALTHFSTEEEKLGEQRRLGRELFVEHRCFKCHDTAKKGMPELAMDAPSFEEIGARRNYEWMARWIENPKRLRAKAQMPQIFHGENATNNSRAAAAFLASLATTHAESADPDGKQSDAGKKLFAALHCVGCHNAPDVAKVDPTKISLKEIRRKFAPGALVTFLKAPDAHYEWIAMPTFKLSDEQRTQLAAYLLAHADKAETPATQPNTAAIVRGKELVQTSGCLNCHALKLENRFSAKSLPQLSDWKSGCLADAPADKQRAPNFQFSSEQREALRAFAAADRASLSRHVPSEFAERQSRLLNCAECHNKIENIPRFEILGGKLKPEWSSRFIAGKISYKPRPWLAAQMPAFAKRAEWLAEGLAMQHGFPAHSPVEPPVDLKAAEIGRNLVSVPPHGFSCTTCHAVGKFGSQAIETPGINLAYSGERLLPSFFHLWVLSPQLTDPVSKMPTYFDEEGHSPLTDVFDGDGPKQIDAIWQYIRLGEKMSAPKTE